MNINDIFSIGSNANNVNILGGLDDSTDTTVGKTTTDVHIRIQQRNGRKCITTVENIDKINGDKDFLDELVKSFRKKFSCSVTLHKSDDNAITLQGDHRDNVRKYLVEHNIVEKDKVKVHGY